MFNGAELHLLVNHLPVIGFIGCVLGLAASLISRSADIRRFMLAATILTGLSGLLPAGTGEDAEEVVEHLPGISKHQIHEHEEIAEKAMVLGLLSAGVAFAALLAAKRRPETLNMGVAATLALSLVSAGVMGKAAHEGGKIRHSEIIKHKTNHDQSELERHRE